MEPSKADITIRDREAELPGRGSGGRAWAIVLAAGDGRRLDHLTRDPLGRPTPKQFCSVSGGPTLIQETLARGARVVGRPRVVTVVAAQHEAWWRQDTAGLPEANFVIQPLNRGTAAGILLPLLSISRRDPDARVVVLPSDHFIRREAVLDAAIRAALAGIEDDPGSIVLLGVTPERPDPELGWIVPEAGGRRGIRRVARFVEKPPLSAAARLKRSGALWNSFIFVGRASTLIDLYRRTLPELLRSLGEALGAGPGAVADAGGSLDGADSLDRLYRGLDPRDFSRDLLEPNAATLRVLATGACGWSDLGTPERLARCALSFVRAPRPADRRDRYPGSGYSRPVLAAVV